MSDDSGHSGTAPAPLPPASALSARPAQTLKRGNKGRASTAEQGAGSSHPPRAEPSRRPPGLRSPALTG